MRRWPAHDAAACMPVPSPLFLPSSLSLLSLVDEEKQQLLDLRHRQQHEIRETDGGEVEGHSPEQTEGGREGGREGGKIKIRKDWRKADEVEVEATSMTKVSYERTSEGSF